MLQQIQNQKPKKEDKKQVPTSQAKIAIFNENPLLENLMEDMKGMPKDKSVRLGVLNG